ncbi:substrate-binding domain-containing protein [Stappia sp. GBMRC 2046]|uniref:Substrate-binding domain-containing protein n=2 Tax=Stappia sediminis TaxID=2692190 RepID=A0A7X3S6L0_9HYPH|nr:substrate-binding domain-containing protein [Stappia sediminis]
MMDVAARAGVSQATVSLVLNGSVGARLTDATKLRVREAANALGYKLVRRAKKKSPASDKLIGFVADEVATDPWTPLIFEGAREKALEYGVTMTMAVLRGEGDLKSQLIDQMSKQPHLGLIYATMLTRQVQPPQIFFETPSVLVNCYDKRRRLPSILPGELLGGRTATEHLIRAGRRRIALINGQHGIDASRDRLRGYRQALSSADIPYDPELVYPGNWEPSAGYEGTMQLMRQDNPPDGIFCANDMMALGCYDALKELGLRIPDDISVVGFDDREVAQFMRPPLTTLVLPHYEMGAVAAELLLDIAGGLSTGHDQIKVECPLVSRNSVAFGANEENAA